jgi:hypothetical protein
MHGSRHERPHRGMSGRLVRASFAASAERSAREVDSGPRATPRQYSRLRRRVRGPQLCPRDRSPFDRATCPQAGPRLSGHHQQRRDHQTATGWGAESELQLLPPPGVDVQRIFVAEFVSRNFLRFDEPDEPQPKPPDSQGFVNQSRVSEQKCQAASMPMVDGGSTVLARSYALTASRS